MTDLTREQKRDYAKKLYLTEPGITQKEIAMRVGATEATISKWIREGKWSEEKTSLLTTKSEQLSLMLRQLQAANDSINKRDEGARFPSSKEADAILKLTTAIRNLEQDTNIADKMEVGKQFLAFVRQTVPLEQAWDICRLFDSFVKGFMK